VKQLNQARRVANAASSLALLTSSALMRQRRKSHLEVQLEDRADAATSILLGRKMIDDHYDDGGDQGAGEGGPVDTRGILLGLQEVTTGIYNEKTRRRRVAEGNVRSLAAALAVAETLFPTVPDPADEPKKQYYKRQDEANELQRQVSAALTELEHMRQDIDRKGKISAMQKVAGLAVEGHQGLKILEIGVDKLKIAEEKSRERQREAKIVWEIAKSEAATNAAGDEITESRRSCEWVGPQGAGFMMTLWNSVMGVIVGHEDPLSPLKKAWMLNDAWLREIEDEYGFQARQQAGDLDIDYKSVEYECYAFALKRQAEQAMSIKQAAIDLEEHETIAIMAWDLSRKKEEAELAKRRVELTNREERTGLWCCLGGGEEGEEGGEEATSLLRKGVPRRGTPRPLTFGEASPGAEEVVAEEDGWHSDMNSGMYEMKRLQDIDAEEDRLTRAAESSRWEVESLAKRLETRREISEVSYYRKQVSFYQDTKELVVKTFTFAIKSLLEIPRQLFFHLLPSFLTFVYSQKSWISTYVTKSHNYTLFIYFYFSLFFIFPICFIAFLPQNIDHYKEFVSFDNCLDVDSSSSCIHRYGALVLDFYITVPIFGYGLLLLLPVVSITLSTLGDPVMTSIKDPRPELVHGMTWSNFMGLFTIFSEAYSLSFMSYQTGVPAPEELQSYYKLYNLDLRAEGYNVATYSAFAAVFAWLVLFALVLQRPEFASYKLFGVTPEILLLALSGPGFMLILQCLFSVIDCTYFEYVPNNTLSQFNLLNFLGSNHTACSPVTQNSKFAPHTEINVMADATACALSCSTSKTCKWFTYAGTAKQCSRHDSVAACTIVNATEGTHTYYRTAFASSAQANSTSGGKGVGSQAMAEEVEVTELYAGWALDAFLVYSTVDGKAKHPTIGEVDGLQGACYEGAHAVETGWALLALGLYLPTATVAPFGLMPKYTSQDLDIRFMPVVVIIDHVLKAIAVAATQFFTSKTHVFLFVLLFVCDLPLFALNAWLAPCCVTWVNDMKTGSYLISTLTVLISIYAIAYELAADWWPILLSEFWTVLAINCLLLYYLYRAYRSESLEASAVSSTSGTDPNHHLSIDVINTGPTQRTYIEQLIFLCDSVGYEISVDEQKTAERKHHRIADDTRHLAYFFAMIPAVAGIMSILGFVAVYLQISGANVRGVTYDPSGLISESNLVFRQVVLLLTGVMFLTMACLIPVTSEIYMTDDAAYHRKDKLRREVAKMVRDICVPVKGVKWYNVKTQQFASHAGTWGTALVPLVVGTTALVCSYEFSHDYHLTLAELCFLVSFGFVLGMIFTGMTRAAPMQALLLYAFPNLLAPPLFMVLYWYVIKGLWNIDASLGVETQGSEAQVAFGMYFAFMTGFLGGGVPRLLVYQSNLDKDNAGYVEAEAYDLVGSRLVAAGVLRPLTQYLRGAGSDGSLELCKFAVEALNGLLNRVRHKEVDEQDQTEVENSIPYTVHNYKLEDSQVSHSNDWYAGLQSSASSFARSSLPEYVCFPFAKSIHAWGTSLRASIYNRNVYSARKAWNEKLENAGHLLQMLQVTGENREAMVQLSDSEMVSIKSLETAISREKEWHLYILDNKLDVPFEPTSTQGCFCVDKFKLAKARIERMLDEEEGIQSVGSEDVASVMDGGEYCADCEKKLYAHNKELFDHNHQVPTVGSNNIDDIATQAQELRNIYAHLRSAPAKENKSRRRRTNGTPGTETFVELLMDDILEGHHEHHDETHSVEQDGRVYIRENAYKLARMLKDMEAQSRSIGSREHWMNQIYHLINTHVEPTIAICGDGAIPMIEEEASKLKLMLLREARWHRAVSQEDLLLPFRPQDSDTGINNIVEQCKRVKSTVESIRTGASGGGTGVKADDMHVHPLEKVNTHADAMLEQLTGMEDSCDENRCGSTQGKLMKALCGPLEVACHQIEAENVLNLQLPHVERALADLLRVQLDKVFPKLELPGEEDELEEEKLARFAESRQVPGQGEVLLNRREERALFKNRLRYGLKKVRMQVRDELENLHVLGKSLFERAEALRELAIEIPELCDYFARLATHFDMLHSARIMRDQELEEAMLGAQGAEKLCCRLADELEHIFPNFHGSIGFKVADAEEKTRAAAVSTSLDHTDEEEAGLCVWFVNSTLETIYDEIERFGSWVNYARKFLTTSFHKHFLQIVIPENVGDIGDELRRLGRDLTGAYTDMPAISRDFEKVFVALRNFVTYRCSLDAAIVLEGQTAFKIRKEEKTVKDVQDQIRSRVAKLTVAVGNVKSVTAREMEVASSAWKDLERFAKELEAEVADVNATAWLPFPENPEEWISNDDMGRSSAISDDVDGSRASNILTPSDAGMWHAKIAHRPQWVVIDMQEDYAVEGFKLGFPEAAQNAGNCPKKCELLREKRGAPGKWESVYTWIAENLRGRSKIAFPATVARRWKLLVHTTMVCGEALIISYISVRGRVVDTTTSADSPHAKDESQRQDVEPIARRNRYAAAKHAHWQVMLAGKVMSDDSAKIEQRKNQKAEEDKVRAATQAAHSVEGADASGNGEEGVYYDSQRSSRAQPEGEEEPVPMKKHAFSLRRNSDADPKPPLFVDPRATPPDLPEACLGDDLPPLSVRHAFLDAARGCDFDTVFGMLDEYGGRRVGNPLINDCTPSERWSALHQACLKGDVGVVRELLELKADVHKLNREGQTPLAVLLKHRPIEVRRALEGDIRALMCAEQDAGEGSDPVPGAGVGSGGMVGTATSDLETPLTPSVTSGDSLCQLDVESVPTESMLTMHKNTVIEARRGYKHLRRDLRAYAKVIRRAGEQLRSSYEPMAAHGNRLQRLSMAVHDSSTAQDSLADTFRKTVQCYQASIQSWEAREEEHQADEVQAQRDQEREKIRRASVAPHETRPSSARDTHQPGTPTSQERRKGVTDSRAEAASRRSMHSRRSSNASDASFESDTGETGKPVDGHRKLLFGEKFNPLGAEWEDDKTAMAKEIIKVHTQLEDMGGRLVSVGGAANSIPGSQLLFLCLKCINDCATNKVVIGQQVTESLLNSLIQFLAITQSQGAIMSRLPGGENIFREMANSKSENRAANAHMAKMVREKHRRHDNDTAAKLREGGIQNFRVPSYKRHARHLMRQELAMASRSASSSDRSCPYTMSDYINLGKNSIIGNNAPVVCRSKMRFEAAELIKIIRDPGTQISEEEKEAAREALRDIELKLYASTLTEFQEMAQTHSKIKLPLVARGRIVSEKAHQRDMEACMELARDTLVKLMKEPKSGTLIR